MSSDDPVIRGARRGGSEAQSPGLCATCRHAQSVRTRRGSVFWRCARAEDDPAYARYPRLPVLACAGHEAREAL
jgi:hypothetical protein